MAKRKVKSETTSKRNGRPPKFDNQEQLSDLIIGYTDNCTQLKLLPNKAGLCIWLGIHRDTYNEYKKKPEFSDTLKGAELWIEQAWVQRLAGNAPTGAIFYLKNAFKDEYRDRQETDITTKGEKLTITGMTISKA